MPTALDLTGDTELTIDVYLENTQPLELSTDVESNTPSFVEEATEEATVSVPGDYLKKPPTRATDKPSPSRESNKFISALVKMK